MGSMVERAKRLDAEIRAAGGLKAYWEREQRDRCAQGIPHYKRLIDPVTDEVVAEIDCDRGCPSPDHSK